MHDFSVRTHKKPEILQTVMSMMKLMNYYKTLLFIKMFLTQNYYLALFCYCWSFSLDNK